MSNQKALERSTISFREQVARKLVEASVDPLFPANVLRDEDVIYAVEQMLEDGPVIVVATHLCARDPLEMVLRPIQLIKGVDKKAFFAPMEVGEARRHRLLKLVGKACAVHSFEVYTEDTRAKMKKSEYHHLLEGIKERHGQRNYLKIARKALQAGQMIALTPQGGRRPSIQYSSKEPLKFILGEDLDRWGQVGVLFIGISIPDESEDNKTDYNSEITRGLNVRREFDIRPGHAFTLAELKDLAHRNGKTLDEMAIVILASLVDPNYNAVDPEDIWNFNTDFFFNFMTVPVARKLHKAYKKPVELTHNFSFRATSTGKRQAELQFLHRPNLYSLALQGDFRLQQIGMEAAWDYRGYLTHFVPKRSNRFPQESNSQSLYEYHIELLVKDGDDRSYKLRYKEDPEHKSKADVVDIILIERKEDFAKEWRSLDPGNWEETLTRLSLPASIESFKSLERILGMYPMHNGRWFGLTDDELSQNPLIPF